MFTLPNQIQLSNANANANCTTSCHGFPIGRLHLIFCDCRPSKANKRNRAVEKMHRLGESRSKPPPVVLPTSYSVLNPPLALGSLDGGEDRVLPAPLPLLLHAPQLLVDPSLHLSWPTGRTRAQHGQRRECTPSTHFTNWTYSVPAGCFLGHADSAATAMCATLLHGGRQGFIDIILNHTRLIFAASYCCCWVEEHTVGVAAMAALQMRGAARMQTSVLPHRRSVGQHS